MSTNACESHQKRTTGRARRREATREPAVGEPALGGCCRIEPEPASIEMWPLQSGTWLVPESSVIVPRSAEVRIERLSKAVPRFARLEIAPCGSSPALEGADVRAGVRHVMLPAGDMHPLGWEARAYIKSGGNR